MSELTKLTQFQQYDDACVQLCHFVVMYGDMTHDEIYQFVENIGGVCDTLLPSQIEQFRFLYLEDVQHDFERYKKSAQHQTYS